MAKCEIQWIDAEGNPTADSNEAIGMVYRQEHYDFTFYKQDGRAIHYPESDLYYVCENHAKRLNERGMHNWRFLPCF